MQFEVYRHEDGSGDWVVEMIDVEGEGEIFTTIFSGSLAKQRADNYLNWQKNHPSHSEAA
jgi:hypothetical protein